MTSSSPPARRTDPLRSFTFTTDGHSEIIEQMGAQVPAGTPIDVVA